MNPALFKVLDQDGCSIHGGKYSYSLPTAEGPGEWLPVIEKLELCKSGYHLTSDPLRWFVPNCRVFLAEADLSGVICEKIYRKMVCRSVRLVKEITLKWELIDCFPTVKAVLAAARPRHLTYGGDDGVPGSFEMIDLAGLAIPFAKLDSANLIGCNLFGANLRGTTLLRANLAKANLTEANLTGADLAWANLARANLTEANLRAANLHGADLHGADLTKTDLAGADLRAANLAGADLTGADLCEANLPKADLPKANLRAANLRAANLYGADLHGADLAGADLAGADLRAADLSGANLEGCEVSSDTKIDLADAACVVKDGVLVTRLKTGSSD